MPERVSGDELCPAVDDVEVPLLTTLGDCAQQLLVLIVDDSHEHLERRQLLSTENLFSAITYKKPDMQALGPSLVH